MMVECDRCHVRAVGTRRGPRARLGGTGEALQEPREGTLEWDLRVEGQLARPGSGGWGELQGEGGQPGHRQNQVRELHRPRAAEAWGRRPGRAERSQASQPVRKALCVTVRTGVAVGDAAPPAMARG